MLSCNQKWLQWMSLIFQHKCPSHLNSSVCSLLEGKCFQLKANKHSGQHEQFVPEMCLCFLVFALLTFCILSKCFLYNIICQNISVFANTSFCEPVCFCFVYLSMFSRIQQLDILIQGKHWNHYPKSGTSWLYDVLPQYFCDFPVQIHLMERQN